MQTIRSLGKKFFQILLLILTLFLAPEVLTVKALESDHQETQIQTFTLEDFDIFTDQDFQGVQVDRTFNLALPGNWSFTSEATLTIEFSHSPALNPISSLLVRWNGDPVGSVLLTEENAHNGSLAIQLPPEEINPGFNTLQIEFYMGIAEDFCIDFDNPAVWAVVHKDSSLELSYQEQSQETDLNLAPEILIDSSLLAENKITLIVPPNPGFEITQALARMAANLGDMAEWRNTDISFLTMQEAAAARPMGDLVVIGALDQINASFPELHGQVASLLSSAALNQAARSANDGLVLFQASPFDPAAKALILTGDNLTGVEKSTLAATLESFFVGANGSWSVVRAVPDLPKDPDPERLSISLEDLGLDTQTASGTREQTIEFNLPLSALWDINAEAWLELHFAHSALLNSERSTLSILLNDIPVASLPLKPETAQEGFQEIRVPLKYFKVGENTFTLRANLEPRDSRQDYRDFCTDETYPRSWFTLHADTALVLPEKPEKTSLDLNHFPFGFAEIHTFENFTFIVDSEYSPAALDAMVQLAVAMGKALRGSPAGLNLRALNSFEGDEGFQYHILIGAGANFPTPTWNDRLPLPLDLETGAPQPEPSILELDTPAGIQAVIQAFQEGENIFLLFSASDPEDLPAAGRFLADPAARSALAGNLAILTAPDQAMSFQVPPEKAPGAAETAPPSDPDSPLQLGGQSFWIVRISIGLGIASVIALVIALVLKNRNADEV